MTRMSESMTPEEEAEQKDQKLLSENKAKIDSIMQLLKDMDDRDKAEDRVNEARGKTMDASRVKSDRVFHNHGGKKVAVSRGASENLELGDALELHMRTREHGADLHRALERAAETRVRILDRIMDRHMGKGGAG